MEKEIHIDWDREVTPEIIDWLVRCNWAKNEEVECEYCERVNTVAPIFTMWSAGMFRYLSGECENCGKDFCEGEEMTNAYKAFGILAIRDYLTSLA